MRTPRTHPPAAADEPTTLVAFLDFYRDTLRRQTEDLTAEQLRVTLGPSSLTLGGLLKHLAFVEDHWLRHVLTGEARGEPWASVDWRRVPDWDLDSAAEDSPAELRALYDQQVAAADALLRTALTAGGLDTLAVLERHGKRASLRWIVVHLIEEYARHCGHADLIRESIDGAVDL